MNISLRRARKLEIKLKNFLNESANYKAQIRVNSNSEQIIETLHVSRVKFETELENKRKLISARFKIRELIGKNNHNVGIDNLITQREHIKEQIVLLQTMLLNDTVEDCIACDIIEAERKLNESMGKKTTVVPVSIINSNLKSKYLLEKNSLKARLDEIDEKILSLNNSTTITIDDDIKELLLDNRLI
ncbi:hypothetical protein RVBP17_0900 [Pseudomonas phage sp. 30-3]|nr:hypothetical protein GBBBJNDB_00021 [Pseudomonas phage Callisto]WPK39174.1 hypothetical protein Cassandra_0498 [Pseudomonas phage Cassandra]WPK39686.1 hypothetical protein Deiofobo_0489 [Pseudomonas phage Deifobo]WPK40207.1 hypothetical protein ETTORE_0498 [Pseudomonas phage Ettore]WPK40722.1 hypothetical protein Paride_0492 [Pseudomonas phage Paride]VOH53579.1 hypothetical protein MIJ3_00021 [Pseudomonas phage vB_PaeM_MIJ3]BDR25867.1 hypothetical protein RVBP16_3070 [Pseudomonas phage sp.